MTALIRGGTVRPHVQSCADAIAAATGAESFGTYPGHDPSLDLATDIFVPVSSTDLGDAITEYLAAHWERHGVDYWIYRQRIRNPPDRDFWRAMEDRGSNTANHVDHVHVSFLESAPPAKPKPTPKPKEIEVSKVAYPVTVPATGKPRSIPVPAIGGGFGWTKCSVTFASSGVDVRSAKVGPNERPIPGLAPSGVESAHHYAGRGYIDLAPGDEWVTIHLDSDAAGTLDLMIEASDAK